MRRTLNVCCCIFAMAGATVREAPASEVIAKIVVAIDGDTVVAKTSSSTITVRLEGIDAPEKGQPSGPESREALRSLLVNKQVVLKTSGTDKYGRTLATILLDGNNINLKMVSDGLAWHYKQYSKDEDLAKAEAEARTGEKGLWVEKNPTAPWDFRHPPAKPAIAPPEKTVAVPVVTPPATANSLVTVPKAEPIVKASASATNSKSGSFKESEAEKAYEKANGVEVVHRKDGSTYERRQAGSSSPAEKAKPSSSSAPTSSKGKSSYKESAAEKAYEKATGKEVVHKKDGTTYERKARSKK
ncbi:thermonuclease family protein [Schlesneria paludicola]|uniref:thermonuclease family protein n=1 Tax=Schlesneria paludicola TaxID=360056 RepID=UPI000299D6A2|nr:thermonuclease family protein [Schlesneria paludicola]